MTVPAASSDVLNWPLMENNIDRQDLDAVIKFLGNEQQPILTQSSQVRAFEEAWSRWLGVKYSVLVNSGSSANLISIHALKHIYGDGEVIVPTLTWVSDIAAILQCNMEPVFVDIDPRTLGMDTNQVLEKITPRTRAVFLTHILGYNALTDKLVKELQARNIPLIEDVCESHGATFNGSKCGSIGLMSNFSFYYAHHMSTIEGGVVCTNDEKIYQNLRMLRSHGMVRESSSQVKEAYAAKHSDLNPDFIFAFPAYNFRSTEINAVMGLSQLKRLDDNNSYRTKNLQLFLKQLDPQKYYTDFDTTGSCNYAFTLLLRHPNKILRDNVEKVLRKQKVEIRRGMSGGGNQLRQPYLSSYRAKINLDLYPHVDHVHFYGWYIGNYPSLKSERIAKLCSVLNAISDDKPVQE